MKSFTGGGVVPCGEKEINNALAIRDHDRGVIRGKYGAKENYELWEFTRVRDYYYQRG